MAKSLRQALKTLKLEPAIHCVDSTPFYIDDYTGEPIKSRVGFPGVLVHGEKCPEANRALSYGAFKNANVAARFIIDSAGVEDNDDARACLGWLAGACGVREIFAAPPRATLSLFGGKHDHTTYHRQYAETTTREGGISVKHDITNRQEKHKAKQAERASQADEMTAQNFNLRSYVNRDASKDGVSHYEIYCYPSIGLWDVHRCPPAEGSERPISDFEQKLQMRLPLMNGEESSLHIQPNINKLNKRQRDVLRKLSARQVPDVRPEPKNQKKARAQKKKVEIKAPAESGPSHDLPLPTCV